MGNVISFVGNVILPLSYLPILFTVRSREVDLRTRQLLSTAGGLALAGVIIYLVAAGLYMARLKRAPKFYKALLSFFLQLPIVIEMLVLVLLVMALEAEGGDQDRFYLISLLALSATTLMLKMWCRAC